MKKVLSLILSLAMLLIISACGSSVGSYDANYTSGSTGSSHAYDDGSDEAPGYGKPGHAYDANLSMEETLEIHLSNYVSRQFGYAYETAINPYDLAYQLSSGNTEGEIIDKYFGDFDSHVSRMERRVGTNIVLTDFYITDCTTYTADEVAKFSRYLEEHYNYPAGALEDLSFVNCSFTVSGNSSSLTGEDDLVMVKVDGNWYCTIKGIGSLNDINRILSEY